jgi:hypothetical protein
MAGKDLRELFHETLKDIYFAEKKSLEQIPIGFTHSLHGGRNSGTPSL